MALAVGDNGAVYVAGFTDSLNFPSINPEAQSFNAGGNVVFVAKINPNGNTLSYCTYLGGIADDRFGNRCRCHQASATSPVQQLHEIFRSMYLDAASAGGISKRAFLW